MYSPLAAHRGRPGVGSRRAGFRLRSCPRHARLADDLLAPPGALHRSYDTLAGRVQDEPGPDRLRTRHPTSSLAPGPVRWSRCPRCLFRSSRTAALSALEGR